MRHMTTVKEESYVQLVKHLRDDKAYVNNQEAEKGINEMIRMKIIEWKDDKLRILRLTIKTKKILELVDLWLEAKQQASQ